MLERAAVREDVAQDAVLGVVDLPGRERDGAVRGAERARGRDDAAAGVVREVDGAGVVVDAGELAAGKRALAVVVVADLADLRARGAVGALMQETAERVEGPGDARAGRVDALGDAARSPAASSRALRMTPAPSTSPTTPAPAFSPPRAPSPPQTAP